MWGSYINRQAYTHSHTHLFTCTRHRIRSIVCMPKTSYNKLRHFFLFFSSLFVYYYFFGFFCCCFLISLVSFVLPRSIASCFACVFVSPSNMKIHRMYFLRQLSCSFDLGFNFVFFFSSVRFGSVVRIEYKNEKIKKKRIRTTKHSICVLLLFFCSFSISRLNKQCNRTNVIFIEN